ncbi:integrin-linked protein kinase 1-like [Magnolia sinica]|uniref:integrin-linked protein kinase 1-like n=1 Tax=Magnolia sinica TaxID=86752 RepID=UPI0026596285|nr:integrin-linked protein kinase 1-like [Magnolia sinica]
MQLLFLACKGDVKGVEDLLNEGIDVNSIDLDGRTALHIAACEGHADIVKLLLRWRVNIDARDRWGGTVLTLKVTSNMLSLEEIPNAKQQQQQQQQFKIQWKFPKEKQSSNLAAKIIS